MRFWISGLLCLFIAGRLPAEVKIGGPTSPDGKVTVAIDLPASQRTKNVGGKDGAGLCVFTSIGHEARWQNEARLVDFQAKMKAERGGGWPEKVDQMIAKYGAGTKYLQYEGTDPSILIAAIKSGRMPGVTWNGFQDPHYRGARIAHMVNCVAFSGTGATDWVCLLDNNFIGDADYVWMRPADFQKGWTGGQQGWAVILCSPPPPPIPTNRVSVGQWGAGGCGPVGPMVQPQVTPIPVAVPSYEWRKHSSDPGRAYLYFGGSLVGGWDIADSYYRPFDGRVWGTKIGRPPATLPAWALIGSVTTDYGVRLDKLHRGERYSLDGHPCTRSVAHRVVGKSDPMPTDAGYLRLTVIDSPDVLQKVQADLEGSAALAPWRGKLAVQLYPPEHWGVNSALGFPVRGLLIQTPPDALGRGVVLHRQSAYTGPNDLATALRRADPNYQPANDPDLTKTPALPSISFDLIKAEHVTCVVCGIVLALLLRRKQ